LRATTDHARECVGAAEDVGRVSDVAAGEGVAHAGAREGAAVIAVEIGATDLEAVLGTEALEEREVAAAGATEAEVSPDDERASSEVADEEIENEALGREGGEGVVEGLHEHLAHAEAHEQLCLAVEGGQSLGHRTPEHGRGVRIERQDRERRTRRLGCSTFRGRRVVREDELVTAVHAVEVADGDHAGVPR